MTKSSKKTAGALAGAVSLAFGAYTIGSQADGGSALADTASTTTASASTQGHPARFGGSRGAGPFADLAKELGVQAPALRQAFVEVRRELPRKNRRMDRAKDLANALGLPTEKVNAALETLRPGRGERRDELAGALAKELGIDSVKVRAALDAASSGRHGRGGRGRRADPGPGGRHRRSGHGQASRGLADVAKALGVEASRLQAALEKIRPDVRDDRRADRVEALARALGVETAKVRAAVDKLGAEHEAAKGARRKALTAALARKLNLDAAKVEEALDSVRFGMGRHGGFGAHRGGHRHP
ncbi:MAG: hypothetical protein H0V22_04790 [Solirubrobacterales bacterium]|nr:hypothetical protein [Solirubrobacterales bacterium]